MAYEDRLFLPPDLDEPFCAVPCHTQGCPAQVRTLGTHMGAPLIENERRSCVACGAPITCLNDYTRRCPIRRQGRPGPHRSGGKRLDSYLSIIFGHLVEAGRR